MATNPVFGIYLAGLAPLLSLSLREALVSSASHVNHSEQPHLLAAQTILGEPTCTRLWEAGRALTQEEALQYALQPHSS